MFCGSRIRGNNPKSKRTSKNRTQIVLQNCYFDYGTEIHVGFAWNGERSHGNGSGGQNVVFEIQNDGIGKVKNGYSIGLKSADQEAR